MEQFFSYSGETRQHLISVPLAVLQMTYEVSLSLLSTIKGAAEDPDSASCLNKAMSDSLGTSADTWPATHPTQREATWATSTSFSINLD